MKIGELIHIPPLFIHISLLLDMDLSPSPLPGLLISRLSRILFFLFSTVSILVLDLRLSTLVIRLSYFRFSSSRFSASRMPLLLSSCLASEHTLYCRKEGLHVHEKEGWDTGIERKNMSIDFLKYYSNVQDYSFSVNA